jgi:cobalt-precorrin 5A hydrolase/precorrin-3B C17-methyltransferase
MKVALIALTAEGAALAARLKPALTGAEIHGLAGRVGAADRYFERTIDHLAALFRDGRGIVGICAAGILIRALASHLRDKLTEPPVLAVAEDASTVVPLLGGHRGANDLAERIARVLGTQAAITTAGELRFGLALDTPPPGWRIATRDGIKSVAAALLAGEPVALRIEAGDGAWLRESSIAFADRAEIAILVTDRAGPWDATLIYHPPTLALGVGCERGTDGAELAALARETLAHHGLAEGAVALVASLDLKTDERAVHDLAAALGVPARFFDAATLEAQTPRLANPSDLVFRETGCHGVAEGAALAAVGAAGALIGPKTKSPRATCAVARAPRDIAAAAVGRARGRLSVVGIGPGDPAWRTPEVSTALEEADDIVGYGLYLDLIADAIAGKPRHATDLGEEEARVKRALDLSAEGRRVCLVSSGDAGIYALATLVFELMERIDRADWNRVDIAVLPGVSAVQAAAARAGAPLGHDFCAISLSDLLTPWPAIRGRLEAAATGDFVVAIYNPASLKRRRRFEDALAILRPARPPETPVVLARNLGRAGEAVEILPLSRLTVDRVDMLTLVVIGSSRTRAIERGGRRWVYTPRGYGDKSEPAGRAAP